MTDPLLRHFDDGGDLDFINGQLVMSDGLETAAYLSLFGGNERDDGSDATLLLEWWGNKIEQLPERRYRSQLQNLLASLPLVPANLRRFEDAGAQDLAWFVDTGLATFLRVIARIPRVNTLEIEINIVIDDVLFQFVFLKGPPEQKDLGPI